MEVAVMERPSDGATVVSLTGQLDVDSAPRLQAVLTDLLDRSVNRIVVDLGRLAFCDSIGLSAFVFAHKACTAAGGYLRLAAPGPMLLRVLTVVGLLSVLPAYDSVEAACTGDETRMHVPSAKAWPDR